MTTHLESNADIPIIDISPLAGDNDSAAKTTGEALCRAFETVGFAYISGHGISESVIDAAFAQSRAFFESPDDTKRSLAINDAHRGYIPLRESQLVDSGLGRSSRPNLSESFFVLYDANPDGHGPLHEGFLAGPNQWPAWLPQFEPAVRTYLSDAENVCRCLLSGFALGLGLAADGFDPFFIDATTYLRMLHYPPHPDDADAEQFEPAVRTYLSDAENVCRCLLSGFALGLGLAADGFDPYFIDATTYLRMLHYPPHPDDADAEQYGQGPHTDFGAVTLLAQDGAGGLQVRHRDGTWISAPPLPGTFVVNVADLFPIWTGGRFVSTPHRVINRSGRNRFSMAYFFDPSLDAVVECLPACRPPADATLPRHLHYGEHAERRLTRNYAFRNKI